jgi:hypothetical protein
MLAVSLERTRNARHLRSHRHGPGRADPRPARCISRRQPARPVPGADVAAVIGQQFREERGQLEGNVEHDTIGQHAEPSR